MSKEIPENLTPEQLEAQKEEARMAALVAEYSEYIDSSPEVFEKVSIPPEERRECREEVYEFEEMVSLFESEHPLELLHSILTEEEAVTNLVRISAKTAINPILKKLQTIRDETNISPEELRGLEAKWRGISDAFGTVVTSSGKVRHGD